MNRLMPNLVLRVQSQPAQRPLRKEHASSEGHARIVAVKVGALEIRVVGAGNFGFGGGFLGLF